LDYNSFIINYIFGTKKGKKCSVCYFSISVRWYTNASENDIMSSVQQTVQNNNNNNHGPLNCLQQLQGGQGVQNTTASSKGAGESLAYRGSDRGLDRQPLGVVVVNRGGPPSTSHQDQVFAACDEVLFNMKLRAKNPEVG
jgi:hypothetical protein